MSQFSIVKFPLITDQTIKLDDRYLIYRHDQLWIPNVNYLNHLTINRLDYLIDDPWLRISLPARWEQFRLIKLAARLTNQSIELIRVISRIHRRSPFMNKIDLDISSNYHVKSDGVLLGSCSRSISNNYHSYQLLTKYLKLIMELGTNFTGVDQSTCQMVYACVRQYRAAVRTIIMGSFHKAAETWNYNPLPIHQQKLIAAYYRVYELFPDHVNGCFRDWYQWTEGRGRTRTAETFPDLEMIYQVKSNP